MRTWLKLTGGILLAGTIALGAYGYSGWSDAAKDAAHLKQEAADLTARGRGGDSLSPQQLAILLTAQDPGFADHTGIDLATLGAGLTTLTQSLSKRLAFEDFKPGIGKLRQTTYAMSLEQRLTKTEILTLFLDRSEFGRVQHEWRTGLFSAARARYGKDVGALSETEFAELVARLIAPGKLSKPGAEARLKERARRILAATNGTCSPNGARDVWLEGCAEP